MHGVSLRRARLRAPAQAVCVFALVSVRLLAKPAGLPTRSFIDCGGQFWPGLRLRRTCPPRISGGGRLFSTHSNLSKCAFRKFSNLSNVSKRVFRKFSNLSNLSN